ncbi:glucose-1-phosphate adenylyltransferase [Streptomyces sp. URMC 129]|uniref:glucose-1-phosphate adenylyltransferase n=1 Tax=Streptomyces sp. URMC 129 TaxID=3423407 RepID=UPI003F1CDD3C
MMDVSSVLAIVLAGGEGKRLMPLTADRAKPAVPFGGTYRLIDFALSNLVNAGLRRIIVLTQYKSHSLDRHVSLTWRLPALLGDFVTPVPAQQRTGPRWFEGSADAVYQSLNLIYDERPENVIVFGADHIYRIDPRHLLAAHAASGAAVTVAGIRVPRADAHRFGVIETDPGGQWITSFREKPADAAGLPDAPDEVFASMGNYVFRTDALVRSVKEDARNSSSRHDMGGDIIPSFVEEGTAAVFDFADSTVPGATERDRGYWRDVGSIDSYYEASMDVIADDPVFNLYNHRWPILSYQPSRPPAKIVPAYGLTPDVQNSVLSPGVIVAGARAHRSLLSRDVRVAPGADIEGSVLFDNVQIGANAIVRNAILDKNVIVPEGARIGVDGEKDSAHYSVSPGGVVVVAKHQTIVPS